VFSSSQFTCYSLYGGHQAGHTVVLNDGTKHVFSNFGAGTLRGVPTYWSYFCTFSLATLLKEYEALNQLRINPLLLLDTLCPVTTHYDVLYNRILENSRKNARHGSCGLGFGATVERHTLSPVRMYAQDLVFPEICKIRLQAIRDYYGQKIEKELGMDFNAFSHDLEDERFLEYLKDFSALIQQGNIRLVTTDEVFDKKNIYQNFIFEAAQGILLDMDFGFFPNVTRSHTTTKNALNLIKTHLSEQVLKENIEIFYVSRAYQTRHGQGKMTHENYPLELINQQNETNQFNEHQGNFRISPLDLDLMTYALQCDSSFSFGLYKNLIITCLGQIPNQEIPYFHHQIFYQKHYLEVFKELPYSFSKIFYSFDSCSERIVYEI
jgi:adenylosuccinate synthase